MRGTRPVLARCGVDERFPLLTDPTEKLLVLFPLTPVSVEAERKNRFPDREKASAYSDEIPPISCETRSPPASLCRSNGTPLSKKISCLVFFDSVNLIQCTKFRETDRGAHSRFSDRGKMMG
jgi:hypothetical protein